MLKGMQRSCFHCWNSKLAWSSCHLESSLYFLGLKSGLGVNFLYFSFFITICITGINLDGGCACLGVVHLLYCSKFWNGCWMNEWMNVLSIDIVSYWPVPFVLASRWYNYSTTPPPIHLDLPTRDIFAAIHSLLRNQLSPRFFQFISCQAQFLLSKASYIQFRILLSTFISWYITYSFSSFLLQTQKVASQSQHHNPEGFESWHLRNFTRSTVQLADFYFWSNLRRQHNPTVIQEQITNARYFFYSPITFLIYNNLFSDYSPSPTSYVGEDGN